MERIIGVKITDHSLECRQARRRLADLVVRALIAYPFLSRAKQAMFHCDPHAGNLFWTHDDRLAILDWSLVSWLDEAELLALVQILQAAAAMDTQRIVNVLIQLSDRRSVNRPALATVVSSHVEKIRHGQVPGLNWFVGLLDEAVQSARLRFAAELMLLRKSLHTLEGVLAEMGADAWQLDRTVFTQFLVHFAAEFPGRWLVSPFSHDFDTHVSNADLVQMAIDYPSTVARFWLGNSFDVLETYPRTDKLLGKSSFRQGAK
jgi:ubiquinone biosynthesis protein